MTRRFRLLVVDDDRAIRDSYRRMVHNEADALGIGLDYDCAATASDGIPLLDRLPDAALVDMNLGVESGLTVLDAIYKRQVQPRTIMMTGYEVESAIQTRCLKRGFFILHKPAEPHEVLAALFAPAPTKPNSESGIRRVTVRDDITEEKCARIDAALRKTGGNITHAALLLGVNRQWVQRNRRQ